MQKEKYNSAVFLYLFVLLLVAVLNFLNNVSILNIIYLIVVMCGFLKVILIKIK